MKKITLLFILGSISFFSFGQTDTTTTKKENIKKGFSFGALPVISYDTDIGFKYGALANIYHFGDGSTYPKYFHSLYLEWSRTTKGSGINQIIYDTEHLIPKTRMTLEASYFTEQALGFYGFNGYNSVFYKHFEDDQSDDYLTRMYYKHERNQLRLKADFQRYIWKNKLRFLLGFAHYNTAIATVDIKKLNEGKESDLLPDTTTLYDNYVNWGIIKEDEKNGGQTNMFKMGFVYDSRDEEGNPMKGIWSEALILYAPSFTGKESSYMKLALTHRQYFTLKKKVLNLAYRISYQPKIAGEIPFYMLPFVYDSKQNRDGLGGAKTLRGILRNRIVGNDLLFANVELRWKFYRGIIKNQNLYLAINTFFDAGMVTKQYQFETSNIPPEELENIVNQPEALHGSYGAGINIVLNSNFIISINYGRALNPQDGKDGVYIGLNFLF